MDNHIIALKTVFTEHRNEENAVAMEKYMRGKFPFLGLRATERKELSKGFIKGAKFNSETVITMIRTLWDMPEREYQNMAVDYLVKNKRHLTENHIDFVEELIITKSWWDTVDALVSHLVGELFLKYPTLIEEKKDKWLQSNNIWLQRAMLIFQLKYKEKTDKQLLFSIIEQTSHINEFFIQKAIGWSLREYSKTDPDAVLHFIDTHELSNLAKREGLKYTRENKTVK